MKLLKLPEGAQHRFPLKLIGIVYLNSLDIFESLTSKQHINI